MNYILIYYVKIKRRDDLVYWSKILYNKIGRVDKMDKIVDGYIFLFLSSIVESRRCT
jgi:hypothetical protein